MASPTGGFAPWTPIGVPPPALALRGGSVLYPISLNRWSAHRRAADATYGTNKWGLGTCPQRVQSRALAFLACYEAAARKAPGCATFAITSPIGPPAACAEFPGLQRQQRKHQLGETIAFFQMRIAGEDETIDAKRHVFTHARGHLVRITDQRGAAPPRTRPTPAHRLGLISSFVAATAVQLRHAALPYRVEFLETPFVPPRLQRRRHG